MNAERPCLTLSAALSTLVPPSATRLCQLIHGEGDPWDTVVAAVQPVISSYSAATTDSAVLLYQQDSCCCCCTTPVAPRTLLISKADCSLAQSPSRAPEWASHCVCSVCLPLPIQGSIISPFFSRLVPIIVSPAPKAASHPVLFVHVPSSQPAIHSQAKK